MASRLTAARAITYAAATRDGRRRAQGRARSRRWPSCSRATSPSRSPSSASCCTAAGATPRSTRSVAVRRGRPGAPDLRGREADPRAQGVGRALLSPVVARERRPLPQTLPVDHFQPAAVPSMMDGMRKLCAWLGVAMLTVMFAVVPASAQASEPLKPYVVLVLDTSGSMNAATGSGPPCAAAATPGSTTRRARSTTSSTAIGDMVFALGRFRESTSTSGTFATCDANGDGVGNGGDNCNTQGVNCSACDESNGSGCTTAMSGDHQFQLLTPLVDGNNQQAAFVTDRVCGTCSMPATGSAPTTSNEIWGVHPSTFTPLAGALKGTKLLLGRAAARVRRLDRDLALGGRRPGWVRADRERPDRHLVPPDRVRRLAGLHRELLRGPVPPVHHDPPDRRRRDLHHVQQHDRRRGRAAPDRRRRPPLPDRDQADRVRARAGQRADRGDRPGRRGRERPGRRGLLRRERGRAPARDQLDPRGRDQDRGLQRPRRRLRHAGRRGLRRQGQRVQQQPARPVPGQRRERVPPGRRRARVHRRRRRVRRARPQPGVLRDQRRGRHGRGHVPGGQPAARVSADRGGHARGSEQRDPARLQRHRRRLRRPGRRERPGLHLHPVGRGLRRRSTTTATAASTRAPRSRAGRGPARGSGRATARPGSARARRRPRPRRSATASTTTATATPTGSSRRART